MAEAEAERRAPAPRHPRHTGHTGCTGHTGRAFVPACDAPQPRRGGGGGGRPGGVRGAAKARGADAPLPPPGTCHRLLASQGCAPRPSYTIITTPLFYADPPPGARRPVAAASRSAACRTAAPSSTRPTRRRASWSRASMFSPPARRGTSTATRGATSSTSTTSPSIPRSTPAGRASPRPAAPCRPGRGPGWSCSGRGSGARPR